MMMRKYFSALLFLGLGLLVLGCGSQDRYRVMGPEDNRLVGVSDWSDANRIPLLFNTDYNPQALDWQGALVFVGSEDLIYQVVAGGYEIFPRFSDSLDIRDLIVGPDGNLWALGSYGVVKVFIDGSWAEDVDLNLYGNPNGMTLDPEGRLLIYGNSGMLWRRESDGQWEEQEVETQKDLILCSSAFGYPPFFLTGTRQIIEEVDGQWVVTESVLNPEYYSYVECLRTDTGGVVLLSRDEKILAFRQDETWTTHSFSESIRLIFFMDGNLYGVDVNNDEIMVWNGEGFESFAQFSFPNYLRSTFPRDGGQQFILEEGASFFWDGTTMSESTPALGGCRGAEMINSELHLVTKSSIHLILREGVWMTMGRVFESGQYNWNDYFWTRDDQNQPLFVGDQTLVQWDGEEYNTIELEEVCKGFYRQNDGRVVLVGTERIAIWSQGQLQWLSSHQEYSNGIRGCIMQPDESIWVLSSTHLSKIQSGESNIHLTFQGWTPHGMIFDPDRGLVCFGPGRLIVIDGDLVKDMTPLWRLNNQVVEGSVVHLICDGRGGWLAGDNRTDLLIRYNGDQWVAQEDSYWGFANWTGHFQDNGDGNFFWQSGSLLWDLEVQP